MRSFRWSPLIDGVVRLSHVAFRGIVQRHGLAAGAANKADSRNVSSQWPKIID
jgi:hypothetical protein